MHWKKLLKGLAFMLIFLVLLSVVSTVLVTPGDYRNYQWIAGFYAEPAHSLDAVYVSSSTCYAYWNPLVAWDQYGIAVYPYSCNSQHFIAAEHLIREVRKTQPDALFIVNTNTIDDSKLVVEEFHHLLDYMPFSMNKLELIRYLAQTAGLSQKETIELYFPLYRFHARWSELHPGDFTYWPNGLKGASDYSIYLENTADVSQAYQHADGQAPLAQHIVDAANSLMDYCEQEDVHILFVTVPRVESAVRLQELNTLNAMIEARGFDTLDLLNEMDALRLDMTQDFYNEGHTNVHGSVKFTQYLSEYLIREYGLADHRGDAAYASWDKGMEKYASTLNRHILDIEMELAYRTAELPQPSALLVQAEQDGNRVTWAASASAGGYAVYRKQAGKTWLRLGETEALTFLDSTADAGKRYYYTVVPYRMEQGERLYGCFSYEGVLCEAG